MSNREAIPLTVFAGNSAPMPNDSAVPPVTTFHIVILDVSLVVLCMRVYVGLDSVFVLKLARHFEGHVILY